MVGIYLKGKGWLGAPFRSTMTKNIDEKKIIIGRDFELGLESVWNGWFGFIFEEWFESFNDVQGLQ